jgi:hypothetical protein
MPQLPGSVQRTAIYVDGFNFYYGAVKSTPCKWLDFMKLFRELPISPRANCRLDSADRRKGI